MSQVNCASYGAGSTGLHTTSSHRLLSSLHHRRENARAGDKACRVTSKDLGAAWKLNTEHSVNIVQSATFALCCMSHRHAAAIRRLAVPRRVYD
jgi:hypothetical protein